MALEDEAEVLLVDEEKFETRSRERSYSEEFYPKYRGKKSVLRKYCLYTFCVLPWILLVILSSWSHMKLQEYRSRYYIRPDLTYSPVQHLVEYELKIFTTGHQEGPGTSKYAGEPSPEVDKLWTELYPSLVQLIPQAEASKLANKTIIFPHDPQRRYAIELDVFHQLHCLNMIRKALRPDYYKPHFLEGETEDRNLGPRHTTHCIDIIRQSLMCASDISVYTWEWNEEIQSHVNKVKNPHTCRNFDKIRDWATVNTERVHFDATYHEMNDPLDRSTWLPGYSGG